MGEEDAEMIKNRKTYTTFDLFRYPNTRLMTLNLMFNW